MARVAVQDASVDGLLLVVDDPRSTEEVSADARPRGWVEAVEFCRDETRRQSLRVLRGGELDCSVE